MIERMSEARRFNIDKFSEVLGLRGMEKVVSKLLYVRFCSGCTLLF